MLLQKTTKRKNKIMIKKEKNGNNNKRKKIGGRRMEVEVRKKISLTNAKALHKYHKKNNRNNINSISCNNYCSFNTSRDNNKFSIWTKWCSKKGTRGSK